jgi:hypothetical protein
VNIEVMFNLFTVSLQLVPALNKTELPAHYNPFKWQVDVSSYFSFLFDDKCLAVLQEYMNLTAYA